MAESRDLRYFVAVAERLSFTRAAEDLPLSQSALSEAIRRLEAEIGTQLLRRNSRRVELTPAGEVLLADAREVLAQLEHTIDRAKRAGRGEVGRLRVGFEASGAGELSTLARARFAREHPAVRVEPKRFDWGGEADGLREGACDVAFVWLPNDLSGLEVEEVISERRYVGLPTGHRLAHEPRVSIMDLKDEPIMWTRRAPRIWVDWWAVNPRPDGSEPIWGPENENVEEMLEQVAEGAAICITPRSMATHYARPDLAWVPIADIEPLRIALCWRRGDYSVLVSSFANVTRDLAAAAA
ncbi:MAG TPA: LysR family transcriptional regulator [Solirubrobacteraceae bacterium]|nr:LysR family transcriptional regulator [Solirubrobacteraceae bacterium]